MAIYKENSSSTSVATPTFSPAEGTYFEAQNVTIACATTGATLQYKLTENGEWQNYTSAISVTQTTTIWAKATLGEESSEASATYTIPTLITMLAAHELENNAYGLVEGVVTFIDGRNVFAQDETGGICLFLNDGTVPSGLAIGDKVRAYGQRATYNGLIELKNIDGNSSAFTTVSTGNTLPLAVKTISEVLTGGAGVLQSTRVRIVNATIGAINPDGNTTLTQGESTANIYKVPALTGIEAGNQVNVIGVIGYFSNPQIRVASAGDVELYVNSDPVLTVTPGSINVGDSNPTGTAIAANFTVYQANLTDDITLTVSGHGSVLPPSIEPSAEPGNTQVAWSYTPTAAGEISATITVASGSLSQTVTISGQAKEPHSITIDPGITNGTVVADKEMAVEGVEVTLTVTPSTGYALETLTVVDANDDPVEVNNGVFQMPDSDVTVSATFAQSSTVTDVLNREFTGVANGETNYASWTGKTGTSGAVYAGNSAGSHDAIQLRTNNSNSGIVTTTSGGKVSKVTVTWNDNTSSGRKLDIYGKNTAYEAASDLYDVSKQGTKLGTIEYDNNAPLTITGDYAFIGIRSNSGALYADEIDIEWTTTGTLPASVSISPAVTAWDFGEVQAGSTAQTKEFIVTTANLTNALSVELLEEDDYYSIDVTSIPQAATSTTITVTLNPSIVGDMINNLIISGDGLDEDIEVELTATGVCNTPDNALAYTNPNPLILNNGQTEFELNPNTGTGNGGAITYAITSGDTNHGILEGNAFTADHYGTWVITATQAANGIYCGGSAEITITVWGSEIYAIAFNAGTGNPVASISGHEGETITLPTATLSETCQDAGWTFAGWSDEAVTETSTAPDILLPAGEGYLVTAEETLYAVYQVGSVAGDASVNLENGVYTGEGVTGEITWTESFITINQQKGNSTSSVSANYIANPRWYQSHIITLTPTNTISSVVITQYDGKYGLEDNGTSIVNGTASVENHVVTITPTDGTNAITITMGAQARIEAITVVLGSASTYDSNPSCLPKVATPAFSVAAGTYYEAQSVEITCATQGATIYYTTDGTDPTAESAVYEQAITVDASMTIKAIAMMTEMENSAIAEAAYTIVELQTIAEVREQATGNVYTQGIVTSKSTGSTGNTIYMQDDDAAIVVYGSVNPEIGDEIRVSGTLDDYNGLLEIKNPVMTVVSQGNDIDPELMTIEEINATNNQGWYIRIENAVVTEITTSGNSTTTTIAQGANTIAVYAALGEAAVNDYVSFNGNIGNHNGIQIVNPTDINVTSIPVAYTYAYSINGVLGASTTVDGGTSITLAAGTNLNDDFSFAGWTTDANNVAIRRAANSPFTINSDVTFYAVYAKTTVISDEVTTDFVRVSTDLTDWTGTYLIVTEGTGYTKALDGSKTVLDSESNGFAVTINNGRIEPTAEITAKAFSITPKTGGGYSIQNASGYYIGAETNANQLKASTTDEYTNNISYAGYGEVNIENANGPYLRYNDNVGQNRFRFYKSTTYTKQNPVQLFKLGGTSSTTAYYTRVFLNETVSDNITITGPSVVPSGSTLDMGSEYTLANELGANRFVIEDGATAYFINNNKPSGTMQKNITGYGTGTGNWYLFTHPLITSTTTVAPSDCGMITDDITGNQTGEITYDLYRWDSDLNDEWQNYRQNTEMTISPQFAYLYANKNDVTLNFAGQLRDNQINSVFNVALYYNTEASPMFNGWNLKGNPTTGNAAISTAFYKLNNTGDQLNLTPYDAGSVVGPMEGFFVKATGAEQSIDITSTADAVSVQSSKGINVDVISNNEMIDRAIVSFNGGMLGKFYLSDNTSRLYFTEGGQDYAIMPSANEGEMPVSFKGSKNGTYTLSVEPKNVEMNYLHLIDNRTGADVDLLATPSYTFEANTTDYASRFRLVFNANNGSNENGNETFAFFNGSEWVISNMGEATLQVVDVMGRVLSTETVSGNATINLNQTPGVYMLRLVNGDSVKVQKVVVR